MNKLSCVVLFLVVLVSAALVARPLFAQGNTLTQVKSEATELNIDALYVPCEDPASELCVPFPEGGVHPVANAADHEIGLSADGFPANTDVYIVGCVDTLNGSQCTTGESSLDNRLNGIAGGDSLGASATHQFKAAQNPVKSDANGLVSVIARSYTPETVGHFFNAYYLQDVSTQMIGKSISITPEEALHLQDFSVASPTPAALPRTRSIKQRQVKNDPKGRLFDAKSLEPVTGIEVSLLDNFKRLYSEADFINPLIVLPNGEFNFWVPNGIYYLNFAKLPLTHSWPVEMAQIHPNYNLAYYCDPEVKDETTSQTVPLYYQQFSIIEYNKLVHCDVPLDPGTNSPFRSEVKALTYGLTRSSSDNTLYYSGKQSHPFSKVELLGNTTGKVITEVEADKLGFWSVSLALANYPLDEAGLPEQVRVRYTKKDLTGETQFKSSNGALFDPLLRYLEGYCYNDQGKIMPKARVGVKQKNSDVVSYLTTADEKGFFKVGTQYLPSFPYDLIFTDPDSGSSLKQSTFDFVVENKQYLTQKSLNLVSKENREVPLQVTATSSFGSLGLKGGESKPTTMQTAPEEAAASTSNSLWLFFGFISLVIIAGLVLVKRAQQKTTNLTDKPL